MEAAPDVIFLLGVTPSTFRQCEDFSAKYQTSVASCRCQPLPTPTTTPAASVAFLDAPRWIHRDQRLLLKCKFSREISSHPRNYDFGSRVQSTALLSESTNPALYRSSVDRLSTRIFLPRSLVHIATFRLTFDGNLYRRLIDFLLPASPTIPITGVTRA